AEERGLVVRVVDAVGGRVSVGRVRGPETFGELGGRLSGEVVRVVSLPGARGGVPPGRRVSWRDGGRVPG
ncbi:hypothetical protein, partial [Streptomyces dysideae]